MKRAVVLPVIVAAVLAACSGTPTSETTDATAPTPRASEPAQGDIDEYFEALASNDPQRMEAAVKLSAEGSLAAAYLVHQSAAETAYNDAGHGSAPEERIEKTAGGFRLCPADVDCYEYADIETTGGLVASFTINGRDLAGRILAGNGSVVEVRGLGSVELISAYETALGDLHTVLKVKSAGKAIHVGVYNATYRTAEGKQRTASVDHSVGMTDLAADSFAIYVVGVPTSTLGGDLTLELMDSDYIADGKATIKLAIE